jgi:hypothetical protein
LTIFFRSRLGVDAPSSPSIFRTTQGTTLD